MNERNVNGVILEYDVRGAGEPVLLIALSSPTGSCRSSQSRRWRTATS